MSLLRDFEQKLESILEGFFGRQFKSGIQPVEIAKKLAREMDSNRTISVSKVYVPNHYIVYLSKEDAERLLPFKSSLTYEIQSFLLSHAKKEGYELVGRPQIEFKTSPELSLGGLAMQSILEGGEPEMETGAGTQVITPAVKPKKPKRAFLVKISSKGEAGFELSTQSVKIGRSTDNDIIIPDQNVSRYHAEVENMGSGFVLKDVGSTNGTFVNGTKIKEQRLRDGDVIAIGTTKLHYRRDTVV